MIGKILRGEDPRGLLTYLLAPEKSLTVEHVELRNLVSLNSAAAEMLAVVAGASHRNRLVNPIAHIIISWRHDEEVTRDRQFEAARRVLEKLGLADNQCLIIAHDEAKLGIRPGLDGRHHEIHIAVNRVNGDGSVAKLDFEFQRLERACADIAIDMGFLLVPGRFNGAALLMCPGVGNAIGSITAQRGAPTIAQEFSENRSAMASLRAARSKGWLPLLKEFAAKGIAIEVGRKRRRADLHRGLIMIDVADPQRRIKISALDSAGEKWGAIALEKELGPMPLGWQRVFAEIEPDPVVTSASVVVIDTVKPHEDPILGLAAAIRADPNRLARLRDARVTGWEALIDEFGRQGLEIQRGHNVRRGIATGLIMVEKAPSGRSEALSALDTPTEKWGKGALERELGPFPQPASSSAEAARDEGPPIEERLKKTASIYPPLNREKVYADFLTAKREAVERNRQSTRNSKARMNAVVAAQRSERESHYRRKRLRQYVVRALCGRRHRLTARLINAAADRRFARRMSEVARLHQTARKSLFEDAKTERVQLPIWSAFRRAAQVAHAELVRAHAKQMADAAWLDEVRRRRERLAGSHAAKVRLACAHTSADLRLRRRFGQQIEHLTGRGLNRGHVVTELVNSDSRSVSSPDRKRLPALVDEIQNEMWLAHVRKRRDRLHRSPAARDRLEQMRTARHHNAALEDFRAPLDRRAETLRGDQPSGELLGRQAAIEIINAQARIKVADVAPRIQGEEAPQPVGVADDGHVLRALDDTVEHPVVPIITESSNPAPAGSPSILRLQAKDETRIKTRLVVQAALVLMKWDLDKRGRMDLLAETVGADPRHIRYSARKLANDEFGCKKLSMMSQKTVAELWRTTLSNAQTTFLELKAAMIKARLPDPREKVVKTR